MGVKVREKDGAWFVFLNHKGKRYAFGRFGKDKKAAETFASALRVTSRSPDWQPPSSEAPATVRQFAAQWLTTHVAATCKPATAFIYRYQVNKNILPEIGDKPLRTLTRADCKAVVAAAKAKGRAPKTLKHLVAVLSAMLNEAVEQELIAANPAHRLGKFVGKGDVQRHIEPLTREEAAHLLESVRGDALYYPLLLTALRTGMRIGELCGLQWGDIDWHGRFIHVRRTLGEHGISTPKSGKARRVDMSNQLVETLQRAHVAAKAEKLRTGEDVPWVFTRNGKPWDSKYLRERFQFVVARAKLRSLRFHDLRHTYASLLLQAGHSIVYVRDQLGHASIQITVDTYGHLQPGANRNAVNGLDDPQLDAPPAQPPAANRR